MWRCGGARVKARLIGKWAYAPAPSPGRTGAPRCA